MNTARLKQRLARVYGEETAERTLPRLVELLRPHAIEDRALWSQKDVALITYGDSVVAKSERPLLTLYRFLERRLREIVGIVHILPFFPYSSDDGFAVIDYRRVNHMLGDWDDIERIAGEFDLMADLVLNHVSSRSQWFTDFLAQSGTGKDYFIDVDPEVDISEVVRPRVRPLLAGFATAEGEKYVWATFGEDQIDLNFENPDVLLEFIDIFQGYLLRGCRVVRLDAVAFLWKRLGTTCIHLEETHEIVKLFRDVADIVAPGALVLTETNVPHEENISYFGNSDEAHLVYQFALPPLMLHALFSGSAHYLTDWAAALAPPPPGCNYFNFTASHDGIGMRPVEGLLPDEEVEALIAGMRRAGAYASTRDLGGGRKAVYEINTTYFDACRMSHAGEDGRQVARFLCSQLVALALQGIPAVYIHALTASPNDHLAVDMTQHLRAVNRHRWDVEALNDLIDAPGSDQNVVFGNLTDAIRVRRATPAFNPEARQRVLRLGNDVFAFERTPSGGEAPVLVLANVTGETITVDAAVSSAVQGRSRDLLTGIDCPDPSAIVLTPYRTTWLTPVADR